MPRIVNPTIIHSFTAAEALLAHRLVIQSTTDGEVEYPAGAADTQHLGITMTAAAAGARVDVCMLGPCLLTVNTTSVALAVGDWIESGTAAGIGIKRAATDGTTAREIVARALQASSADGEEISVFFAPFLAFTA